MDHATTAALYVTDQERNRSGRESEKPRLSTETAGSSSKSRLPLTSAEAAASLAHAHQKSTGSWKPETQRAAEKAAIVAKDYRVARPSSVENLSPEVFKAAVLASRDSVSGSSPIQRPAGCTDDPYAEVKISVIPRRQIQEKFRVEIESEAINAASGALSRSRNRAESAPVKPVFRPEATYALSAAAAISHRTGSGSQARYESLDRSMEAARIHNIANTNVQLYTSTPPVEIEVEERNRRDTLRAAAVSMAKDMYTIARARTEELDLAGPASPTAQSQRLSPSQDFPSDEPMALTKSTNLHEVAQKIVAEKVAQMPQSDETYGQYYGTPTRSRLSMSRKLRRRSSSESDASNFDKQRSMEIRNQMSFLQNRLHELNSQKRRDQAELMEIARRNVDAAIHDMDEKSYARTGKLSPNVQREWEEKARERAKAESEARLSIFGKIAIAGDKYVDDAEVKAVARARIQPTLDGISSRVEEQRAREMEQRLDERQRKRLQEIERSREAEVKSEQKQGKAIARRVKKDQKTATAERKRPENDGQRFWVRRPKVFHGKSGVIGETDSVTNGFGRDEKLQQMPAPTRDGNNQPSAEDLHQVKQQLHPPEDASDDHGPTASDISEEVEDPAAVVGATEASTTSKSSSALTPPKRESKFKTWLKTKVGRRQRPGQPPSDARTTNGPSLENAPDPANHGSSCQGILPSPTPATEQSIEPSSYNRELQLSQRDSLSESFAALRQWSISTNQSGQDGHPEDGNLTSRRQRLRRSLKSLILRKSPEDLAGNSPLPSATSSSQPTDSASIVISRPSASRTTEHDELRDSFVEETLPPPPNLNGIVGRTSHSPARDSKFFEDL